MTKETRVTIPPERHQIKMVDGIASEYPDGFVRTCRPWPDPHQGPSTVQRLGESIATYSPDYEFARNTAPLRADFASKSDPSDRCVSILPIGPELSGRIWGDDVGGRDRRCSTGVFRAATFDQRDRSDAVGVNAGRKLSHRWCGSPVET